MLVLKEFRIDENADKFLIIRGREEGVISWFFSKIGLDPTVEMICSRREILYKSSSVRKGQLNISIPNPAVTAVVTGYHKPFSALVIAAIFMLSGLTSLSQSLVLFLIWLGLGLACVVYYALNKKMVFGVYNGGDNLMAGLATKRSVIEGVAIDFDKFEVAAALLNKAVLETSGIAKRSASNQVRPSASPVRSAPGQPTRRPPNPEIKRD